MKKIFIIAFVFLFLTGFIGIANSFGAYLGDMNGDDVVDSGDAAQVLDITLEIDPFQPCSNLNSDGIVDISDVILTLRVALGSDPLQTCTGGTIQVNTLKDGINWAGSLDFTLNGPENINGTATPSTYSDKSIGEYTFTYNSGGPSGTSLNSITPSAVQTLENGGITTYNLNFISPPPSVTTDSATNVNGNAATLNATVNPNGLETEVYFEWGTNTLYGDSTTPQNIGNGTVNVSISDGISRLSINTTYHYRVVATNSTDTSYGDDVSFTTTGGTNVSGTISTDTTWTVAGSPYIVTGDIYVRGDPEPTLTIEPGVEVRFDGAYLLQSGYSYPYSPAVGGILKAQGTYAKPIIFTSNQSNPQPGYWKAINFTNHTAAGNILEYVTVEYGGYGSNRNVYVQHASLEVKNSTIRYSSGRGIQQVSAADSFLSITDSTISNNNSSGIYVGNGVTVSSIAGNSFTNNASYAMSIPANVSLGTGNTYSGNGDGIELTGGTVTADTTWSDQSVPYIVTGNINVDGAVLTIEPGVELRFDGQWGLSIGSSGTGTLLAQGTVSDQIVFTSNKTPPQPGDWKGISLISVPDGSILEYVTVEYGGSDGQSIDLAHSSLTIYDSTIRYSSTRGIYNQSATNSFLAISDSTISDNGTEGVRAQNNGSPIVLLEVTGSAISNNGGTGVYIGDNVSVSSIADNSFTNNGSYAMSIPANVSLGTGNTYSGNGDGIKMRGGTLTADTTWSGQSVPYIVTGHIYVDGAVLTIEPGVEVRFNGLYHLDIGSSSPAALMAQGTASDQIIFTSNQPTPQPGNWWGIRFLTYASDQSILEYATVEYGGYGDRSIYLLHASLTIKNSIIRYSSTRGIYKESDSTSPNSFLTITDSIISDNGTDGVYATPIVLLEITGSAISNNGGTGVYIGDNVSVSSIADNSFTNNASYVMNIPANISIGTGNTYSGNGDGIKLRGGTLTADTTWSGQSVPYIVTGHIYVDGAVLTIEPGAELKFDGQYRLDIGSSSQAALMAQGTESDPIVFTSTQAQPGDWRGIRFLSNASDNSILEYVTVEYGGYGGRNIYLANASLTIKNSTIRYSSTRGIYKESNTNSFLTITDSIISDNNTDGLYVVTSGSLIVLLEITRSTISNNNSYGIYSKAELNVSHSNITGNGNGIYSQTGKIADARFNWWGDATGPSGQGPGTGQSVSSGITYEPWLGTTFTYPFYNTNLDEMPQEFDPANNSADFTYSISEDADWTFAIKESGGATVRTFAGSGIGGQVTWDGKDESSVIVPDGIYTYQLSSTSLSDSSESAPMIGNITVETGLPQAEITYPANGQIIANSPVNIQGTADDSDFTDYKVEYGYGTTPTTWTLINSSGTAVNEDTLAQWNPSSLTGRYYTIRLSVNDNAGNTAIATVGVRLLYIYNVNVSNPSFSPNGDGFEDTTTISAKVSYPSDFTMDIKEPGGAVIRSFTGSGESISVLWDGKDTSGVTQLAGVYPYTITATEPGSGSASVYNGSITIDLDPPTVITDPATNVTAYFAELNATANPNGTETYVYFEWGTDTAYGNNTTAQLIGSGTGNVPVTSSITCLAPVTTYHYRVVALNIDGIGYGLDEEFTTTGAIAAATWCGGGADDLASNPDNWVDSAVPQNGDSIIYDGTSTKDCLWDIDIMPASVSINSGYTGTVTLNADLAVTGSLTVSDGTLDLNGKGLDVDEDLIIGSGGTVDAISSIIRAAGDWTNSGIFNQGTSTIILDGTNQTINGSTTFYNLVKTVTSADTLYFESGSTQTISNSLVFEGTAGNLLSLRSYQTGEWMIDPKGTRSVSFVDVKDSNNIHTTTIDAIDSEDSFGNTNWSFDGTECVCMDNYLILAKFISDSSGGIND